MPHSDVVKLVRLRISKLLRSKYFRKRVLTSVTIFIAILMLNFILPRLVPGSFLGAIKGITNLFPQQRQQLLERFGLDQSIWQQFIVYLQQSLLGFPPNFG